MTRRRRGAGRFPQHTAILCGLCAVVALCLPLACGTDPDADSPADDEALPTSAHGQGDPLPPVFDLLQNLEPTRDLPETYELPAWADLAQRGYRTQFLRQDVHGGLQLYDESLMLETGHFHVWSLRALCRLDIGDAEGADADAHVALSLAPGDPTAVTAAAIVAGLSGDPYWALDLAEEALRHAPGNIWALHTAAQLLAMGPEPMRDYHRAVRYGRLAVTLTGGRNPQFLDTLAHAYAGEGELYLASENARQAASAVPDEPSYQAAFQRFQRAFEMQHHMIAGTPPWQDANWPCAPIEVARPPRFE